MGKPISEKHAIEVALFIVAFEHPFDAGAVQALPALQTLLKDDYPVFNATNVMQIKFTDGKFDQESGALSGCQLQKFRDDGRLAWALKVEGNAIVVSCMDYTRWDEVSSKALGHIKTALSLVKSETNAVVTVIHQIIDRFVTENKGNYQVEQVFNTKSRYLTQQALESGMLWHIYQGWFDDAPEFGGKLLNVLNLSTADNPNGLMTTIDHAAHFQFQPAMATDALDDLFMRKAFDTLHKRNKDTIKNLLNVKQQKAIKL
jgi:uncharacterized protein (TIGR04255 family)